MNIRIPNKKQRMHGTAKYPRAESMIFLLLYILMLLCPIPLKKARAFLRCIFFPPVVYFQLSTSGKEHVS
jgi:hypothetical protein